MSTGLDEIMIILEHLIGKEHLPAKVHDAILRLRQRQSAGLPFDMQVKNPEVDLE